MSNRTNAHKQENLIHGASDAHHADRNAVINHVPIEAGQALRGCLRGNGTVVQLREYRIYNQCVLGEKTCGALHGRRAKTGLMRLVVIGYCGTSVREEDWRCCARDRRPDKLTPPSLHARQSSEHMHVVR